MNILIVYLIALLNFKFIKSSKILMLHPNYGSSHILTFRTLAEALAKRNHEMRILRWADVYTYPKISNPNISETIMYVNNSDGALSWVTKEENGKFSVPVSLLWERGFGMNLFPVEAYRVNSKYCKTLMENKKLIAELKTEGYTVAIIDAIFNECGLAMLYDLGVPAIGFWGFGFASGPAAYSTAFNPPSVTPQLLTTYSDNMLFTERVWNFAYATIFHCMMQIRFWMSHNTVREYIPDCPHPNKLWSNLSGMLIQTHPALDYPRLLPPTYLEVAGFHLKPGKSLPKEYLDFIESAGDEGIVLFCLGFTFDSRYVPKRVFEDYFKALGRLNQKVIVKSKGIPNQIPPNVKIFPYVPQADILAHNKTKLFVTHGGMHGVLEAISNAVPMLGIPIFFDQNNNVQRLVDLGVATSLDKYPSANMLHEAMTTVLYNQSYKENVIALKTRMEWYGDPMERALWLINHVIKHNGAEHLKLASRNFGMIQYLCIDIILFIIFVITLLIVILKNDPFFKLSRSHRENHMASKS